MVGLGLVSGGCRAGVVGQVWLRADVGCSLSWVQGGFRVVLGNIVSWVGLGLV